MVFSFCPTVYCDMMICNDKDYLESIGEHLNIDINIMWTGTEIIDTNMTKSTLSPIVSQVKRKLFIWDNVLIFLILIN